MSFQAADSIRGVSFDVGGTLIRAWPSVGAIYAAVCAEAGIALDPAACNREFEAAWARRGAERPAGADRFEGIPGGENTWWAALVTEVLEACGLPGRSAPPIELFRRAFSSPGSWRIYDDVLATLHALKAAGFRLGILSNWDSRLEMLLDALGLGPHFDAVICSALEGREKPAPRIFARAAEALRLEPSQIVHVGDRVLEDYRGAREAGMHALWIDRSPDGAGADGVPAGDRIGSISEVGERLLRRTSSSGGAAS